MDLIEKLQFLMKKNNIKNISQLAKETNIPYTTLKSIFDGDVNDIRLSTSRKLLKEVILYDSKIKKSSTKY